ncbi:hypothetical protein B0H14DRAFT_2603737 [Mycena olivaceomarginata]|nr:hypothetical protein B0H14DRAFT_2603737 [Mycena olivaceomarginata]
MSDPRIVHSGDYKWLHYFEDDISKFEHIKKRPAEIALCGRKSFSDHRFPAHHRRPAIRRKVWAERHADVFDGVGVVGAGYLELWRNSVVTANSISDSLALASLLPPVPLQPPIVSSTLAGGNVLPASTPIISRPDALGMSINIQHPGAKTRMDIDPPDPSKTRMDVDPSNPSTLYPTDCDPFAKDPFAGLSAEDDLYMGLSAEELQEIQDDEHADSDKEH